MALEKGGKKKKPRPSRPGYKRKTIGKQFSLSILKMEI